MNQKGKQELAADIGAKARDLGFSACGIVPLAELDDYRKELEERKAAFPASLPLYSMLDRLDVARQASWAGSVLVCVWDYGDYQVPAGLGDHIARLYLFDWHKRPESEGHRAVTTLGAYLREAGLRAENDELIGIAPARLAATRAGLGRVRRNNFFYTARGSWVWLETWLIDAELELRAGPDATALPDCPPDCPPDCRACRDACPTGALDGPYRMDMARCATRLMYGAADQQKPELRPALGTRVYGCDACQAACPMNRGAATGKARRYETIETLAPRITLDQLATLDAAEFEADLRPHFRFIPAGQSWVLRSNALRAMGNSGNQGYAAILEAGMRDSDPRVASMATWARERLASTDSALA